jgi:hypothetical protein
LELTICYHSIKNHVNSRYLKPKTTSKSKKRNRVISQQAIQLIGEKISADNDHNFQNPRHKNIHSANFDNLMSLGSHYGSNRQLIQPAFEISRKGYNDNIISKSSKFDNNKADMNNDRSGDRNFLIISNNDNSKGRNLLSEDMKSSQSQANHSPMLTKRKNSQRRVSQNNRRHHTKRTIEKSKQIGLNSHLNKHSKASRSETRNTER